MDVQVAFSINPGPKSKTEFAPILGKGAIQGCFPYRALRTRPKSRLALVALGGAD